MVSFSILPARLIQYTGRVIGTIGVISCVGRTVFRQILHSLDTEEKIKQSGIPQLLLRY
jgi:hypothetical protein